MLEREKNDDVERRDLVTRCGSAEPFRKRNLKLAEKKLIDMGSEWSLKA